MNNFQVNRLVDSLSATQLGHDILQNYVTQGFLELWLIGIVGILIHVLMKVKAYQVAGKEYKWSVHLLNALISALIVTVCVYAREDLAAIYPLTKLTAVVLGYFAQSFFLTIANTLKPKENGTTPSGDSPSDNGGL